MSIFVKCIDIIYVILFSIFEVVLKLQLKIKTAKGKNKFWISANPDLSSQLAANHCFKVTFKCSECLRENTLMLTTHTKF